MTEEKKDQRVKAPVLRAKYKSRTLDEFIEKYSRDISRSGMWIKSPKPPALGTLLKVEILLEDGSPVISAVGRVVKRREESEAGPDNPAGMGIRFLKLEDASQVTIDRIVALKGEDAGPHFDNIRTGQTVPPPSAAEPQSAFFGSTTPASQMPAESDRTMMRQMNALLGEALRQVNESAPRKDATGLPAQKATIMGVAAPAGMLQQAIAAGREEQKKADEGPTKVATRSEIDNALEKLKTVEEERKSEPAKADAPKADAPKADAPKAEAPKPAPVKAEPVKAPVAPIAKVEEKKNDSDRSASRSVPPRSLRGGSIPPAPSSRPLGAETSSTPSPEVKAEEKAPEAKAEEKAPEAKAEETPAAKVEETVAEAKVEEKAPVEAPAAEVKAAPVSEEKPAEKPADETPAAKVEEAPAAEATTEAKVEETKAEEKPAEPVALVAKVEEKAEEKKADAAPEKKPEEKKADAAPEKKPEEKKLSAPPPAEGSAASLFIAIAVIAGLAFAVYKWLLNP
jgi:uncharacterized protein (TIGR02266 family)